MQNIFNSPNHLIHPYLSERLGRFFFAILLFILNITIGTLGYRWLEDYNWVEAFYMSMITVSTVGFGEVHPLSLNGRIFTSIFILINLAVFTFLLSIITSFIMEGELRSVLSNYFLIQKIKKMENHIIVCGFGKNGKKACEELVKNKIPFVIIEQGKDNIADLLSQETFKDALFIEGDATKDETLKLAGVEKAKALITTLPKDADSVYVTLTARQLNAKIKIIARANEQASESKLLFAGADKLVRPDQISGAYMANLITRPEITEFLDIISGTGMLKLEEFLYEELKDEYKNTTIKGLNAKERTGVMILGLKDNAQVFLINPSPNIIFGEDNIIITLGTSEQIESFTNLYTNKKYLKK